MFNSIEVKEMVKRVLAISEILVSVATPEDVGLGNETANLQTASGQVQANPADSKGHPSQVVRQ